ncbi:Transcriptional regulator, Xre [Bacillus cereus Rock3-28]|nr:Transcriptional regulator, Xre [Bacillus cereus Rock3-28]
MKKWNFTIWVLPLKKLELKKIYHNLNYVMEYVHKVKLAK